MRWKYYAPLVLKYGIYLACFGLLLFGTFLAVEKYQSQPIATFLSATAGDDNVKISLPYLIFCLDENWYFTSNVYEALKSDPGFDAEQHVRKARERMSTLKFVNISLPYYPIKINQKLTELLYPTFNWYFGPCIGFNSENISIQVNDINPYSSDLIFEFMFDKEARPLISYHSKLDAPNAFEEYPVSYIKRGVFHKQAMTKMIVTSEPTRQNPCGPYGKTTCMHIKGQAMIAKVLQCRVAFLDFGQHLESIANYTKLPICQNQSIKHALDLFMNEKDNCKGAKACQIVKYNTFTRQIDEKDNKTIVNIAYKSFQVEHYTTYISYDLLSLMAELGGLMGMTLGLAFSSIGDLVANIARKYLHNL